MIFYISSQGHAATKWMANAFTLHPEVVCYHAIRSIPPVTVNESYDHFGIPLNKLSGSDPLVAENLAKGLAQCAKHSDKVFGAVHTMWGMTCQKPFEELGGSFAGIIRHPVMQFHSIMNAFTPRELYYRQVPVDYRVEYSYADVINMDPTLFNELIAMRSHPFKSSAWSGKCQKLYYKAIEFFDGLKHRKYYGVDFPVTLDELFKNRLSKALLYQMAALEKHSRSRVLDEHNLFLSKLPESNLIVMEKMTTDFDYFRNKFKTLTGREYPERLQKKIYNLDHGNTHSRKKLGPEDVWSSWPAPLQTVFLSHLKTLPTLEKFYKKAGYWLPV